MSLTLSQEMNALTPTEALESGAEILRSVLTRDDFQFRIVATGNGSGGIFAEGRFEAPSRALEIHFRYTLGLVRYHYGEHSVSHDEYMRQLGVIDRCAYPGFSGDPLDGFRHLSTDIERFGDDFFGSAEQLSAAAEREAAESESWGEEQMVGAVGDRSQRKEARDAFREGDYQKVVALFAQLTYPDRISATESKMLRLAEERSKG